MNRIDVITGMNQAMLGNIPSSLRSIKIAFNSSRLDVFFYFDGSISEKDEVSAQFIIEKFLANFPNYALNAHVIRLDYPKRPPDEYETVYKRREPSPPL